MLKIILFTLRKSQDAEALFPKSVGADVKEFYTRGDEEINALSRRIKKDIQEALLGRVVFRRKDPIIAPKQADNTKLEFTLHLQSASCMPQTVTGLSYSIMPLKNEKPDESRRIRRDVTRSDAVSAMTESTIAVPVDFADPELRDYDTGEYAVEFELKLDSGLYIPPQAINFQFKKPPVPIPWGGILIILGGVAFFVYYWRRSAGSKNRPFARGKGGGA
jgi:hypothetical protein